jgi:hypothetical protein
MRNFIIKTAIFLLPLIFVALLLEFILRQIPNDYALKKNYLDKHSSKIEVLFLGSSHSFYGINPIYTEKCSFNASHISQTLKYDLEILKKYENNLSKLKTIVIPISQFTLFTKLEKSSENWRVKNYNIYYYMNMSLNLPDYFEILTFKLIVNLNRILDYFIKNKSNISCSELGWGTGYNSKKYIDLIESGKVAADRHNKKNQDYFNENLDSLKSIIEIGKKHNAKIFLFTPPSYITYRMYLNKEQLDKTIEASKSISNIYDNSLYINMIEDESFNENDFYDADHLNEIGAEKLTKLIDNYIN